MTEGDASQDSKPLQGGVISDGKDNQQPTPSAMMMHSLSVEQYSGPLPPPQMLADFDLVLPGSAERILKMVENQAQHRMKIESRVIEGGLINERLGVFAGTALASLIVLVGGALVLAGRSAEGFAAVIVAVGGVVSAYVYGDRQRRQEREARRKELLERVPHKDGQNQHQRQTQRTASAPTNRPNNKRKNKNRRR